MSFYYPSNIVGSKIKHAITGKEYSFLVGSKDEEKFFRVIDVSGYYNTNGKKSRGNKIPNKLFFENYNEYKHFYENKNK